MPYEAFKNNWFTNQIKKLFSARRMVLDFNGHLVIADTELQNMKGGHHAISSSISITPGILSQLL